MSEVKCDNGLILDSAASFCAAMVAKHFQEYVSLQSLGTQVLQHCAAWVWPLSDGAEDLITC